MEISTSRHNLAIGGCVFANLVDGFDVLAVAFTGSAIMKEWNLGPATLGLIFSAGLIGMMLGSLFISPLADRFGRRKVALSCMAIMSLGMFASAAAQGPYQLIALRLLTGVGIGGVLATLNTTVAELAKPERRNLTMSIFSAGYPLGSALGGLFAVSLIPTYGWQAVFLVGGILTAIVFTVNLFSLPESTSSEDRIPLGREFVAKLLGGENRGATIAICLAFFLNMLAFFFILNWTPKMTEYLGYSAEFGNKATIIINVGSLAGPLLFGFLADRLGLIRVAQYYFLGFSLSIAAFAIIPNTVFALYTLALVIGLCMAGAMTSLYASAPLIFPGQVRAAGTGLAIGIGRLGGALGPALAGFALTAGMTRGMIYLLFAIPPILVVLLLRSNMLRTPQMMATKEKLI